MASAERLTVNESQFQWKRRADAAQGAAACLPAVAAYSAEAAAKAGSAKAGSRRNRKSTAGKPSFLDRSASRYNVSGYNSLVMLNEDSITELKRSLRGRLIQPGDADYDEARKVYNGMIHKKPRLIARCADVADVIRSVNFATR